MAAWKSGCKGVTVYREGSRTGVIVSNSESESPTSFMESNPPRRPEKLNADVIRFQNNEEKWMAVVGLYEGKPYEVFTGKAEDSFGLPKYVSSGRVTKTKDKFDHNRYDFQYVDRDGYRVMIEGLSRSFDKEYWNYAKLISGILRHGMPIIHVVDLIGNLNMNDESLNTWKNGVTRALMRYIPAGTKPVNNECRECGENSLVYEEGCLKCKSCGFSKCG